MGAFGKMPDEQVKLIKDVGFDGFFTGWAPGGGVQLYREAADKYGMLYQSIHAPFTKAKAMWGTGEAADIAVNELLACLEDTAAVHVPIMVVHTFIGFEDHTPTPEGIFNFGKVVDRAEELGVTIAFENTEGEEYLAALMDAFKDRKSVGFCWDTGHEMCYNHSKDMMALYGDRLVGTHINDNLGIKDFDGVITWIDDLHLLPFDGIADWDYNTARLAKHGFAGPLTFELSMDSKPGRHENDVYHGMSGEEYLTEVYKRACRVGTLFVRNQGKYGK